MTDFSNLAALVVDENTTVEYVFEMIPGKPSIMLSPMTGDNVPLFNEQLKQSAEKAERLAAEAKARGGKGRKAGKIVITAANFDEDRQTDIVMLANFCCKAWGIAPQDATGARPEFNKENCLSFLQALPTYMVDPFRNFAQNVYNFIPAVGDDFKLLTDDAKDALGNSSPTS